MKIITNVKSITLFLSFVTKHVRVKCHFSLRKIEIHLIGKEECKGEKERDREEEGKSVRDGEGERERRWECKRKMGIMDGV